VGAHVGEQRFYAIPSERRPLPVTLLKVVPYGVHVAENFPAPAI
jgi:hypothetical protein